jgi:hypothetical protein
VEYLGTCPARKHLHLEQPKTGVAFTQQSFSSEWKRQCSSIRLSETEICAHVYLGDAQEIVGRNAVQRRDSDRVGFRGERRISRY